MIKKIKEEKLLKEMGIDILTVVKVRQFTTRDIEVEFDDGLKERFTLSNSLLLS